MIPIFAAISTWLHGSKRERTILVGNDPRMRLLAAALGVVHKPVSLIKLTINEAEKAAPGVEMIYATAPGEGALAHVGTNNAGCVIASTTDNEMNQQLCEIARNKFRVPTTIMRLCMLSGVTSWAKLTDAGMARMEWPEVVRAVMADLISKPFIQGLIKLTERDHLVDLELRSPVFVGRTIAELPLGECEVVALTRGGSPAPALGVTHLEMGDVVTVTGPTVDLRKLREAFSSL